LFADAVKRAFLYITFMVGNRYAAFLNRVFKLAMRTVLFAYKPAVIVQKFQNFPNRHSNTIRVIYTYVKWFLAFLTNKYRGYFLHLAAGLAGGKAVLYSHFLWSKGGINMEEIAVYGDKRMTVKEVADVLGVHYDTVASHVKQIFPELVRNGVTTYLNEMQVTAVKLEIQKSHNLRNTPKVKSVTALILGGLLYLLLTGGNLPYRVL
jgi:hypothetical protein